MNLQLTGKTKSDFDGVIGQLLKYFGMEAIGWLIERFKLKPNEKTLQALEYLQTQDEHTQKLIIEKWIEQLGGGSVSAMSGCCPLPKPTTHPTPYGSWACDESKCEWYWVPDIG